jgi:hypothetical protein
MDVLAGTQREKGIRFIKGLYSALVEASVMIIEHNHAEATVVRSHTNKLIKTASDYCNDKMGIPFVHTLILDGRMDAFFKVMFEKNPLTA